MDQQHQPPPNGQFGGNNPGQMQPGQQQQQFQQYQFQPIGHQHQRFAQQQPMQPMQQNQPVQENQPMQQQQPVQFQQQPQNHQQQMQQQQAQQQQMQQRQQMQQHNPQQPQQMQPNQFMQQHYWQVQQMMHRHYQQQQYEMNVNLHQAMQRQQAFQQQQQVQQRQQLQNQMQLQQNGQRPLEMQKQMLNIQVQLNVQQEMQRNQMQQQQMRRQPMLAIEDRNGQEVRNAEPQEPRPRPPVAAAPPEIPAPSLLLQMLMKQGSPDAAPLQLNNPMVKHPEPQPSLPGQRGADQLKRKLPEMNTIDDSLSGSSVPAKRDRIDRDFMGNVAGNDARRGQSGSSTHQQNPAPHRPQPAAVPKEIFYNHQPDFNNDQFDIAHGFAHEEVVGAGDAGAKHQMDQQEEDPQAIIENLRRQLDRAQTQLAKRDEYIDKLQKENGELKSRLAKASPQSMAIESPADTLASGSSDNPSPEMVADQQQRAGQFVAQFVQAARASMPMVNQNVRAGSMPALDPVGRYAMGPLEKEEHRIVRIKQEVPDEYDNANVDTSGIFVDRVLNPQNVQFRNFGEALDYWKKYFEPAAQQNRIEQVLGEELENKHLKNYLFNPDDNQGVPQEKDKVCRNANQMIPRLFEWTKNYQTWADMDEEKRNKWRRAKKIIEEIQRQQVRCGLIFLKT